MTYVISVEQHSPAQIAVANFVDTPPSHIKGLRVIVGSTPTGDFVGHTDKVAWSDGTAWQFDTPAYGWRVWVNALNNYYIYNGSWVIDLVISEQEELLQLPTTLLDFENIEYPSKEIAGIEYTLLDEDNNRLLSFTSSTDVNVIIPLDLRVDKGFLVTLKQEGTGYVNVTATAGVTMQAANNEYATRTRYSLINIIKQSNNKYVLGGDLA